MDALVARVMALERIEADVQRWRDKNAAMRTNHEAIVAFDMVLAAFARLRPSGEDR
jgi:hypothetical protein